MRIGYANKLISSSSRKLIWLIWPILYLYYASSHGVWFGWRNMPSVMKSVATNSRKSCLAFNQKKKEKKKKNEFPSNFMSYLFKHVNNFFRSLNLKSCIKCKKTKYTNI